MDAILLDFYYNNSRTEYTLDVADCTIDITITYLEQLRATLKVGC